MIQAFRVSAAACAAGLLACGARPGLSTRVPADPQALVDILQFAPDICVDVRYATQDNFTKTRLYPVNRCLLRERAARKLAQVQSDLSSRGLGLKVWDCYRPLAIQKRLWELVSDPRYVADPRKGSRHNRAAAVDVTLVSLESGGSCREIEMPTGYDDFSPKAHRDYREASLRAVENRGLLETAMSGHGFQGLPTEWWHFDAEGWENQPLLDVPLQP